MSRSSGFVQTFVSGRLELPSGVVDDDLLLAVNGTVAGTGFVIRDSDTSGEIRALLAEELLIDGHNEVAILVPDPQGGGWLIGAAADITIDYIAEDGHQLDIRSEGDRRLEITSVRESESGWLVRGWAADVKAKETPDRIYVFAGARLSWCRARPTSRTRTSSVGSRATTSSCPGSPSTSRPIRCPTTSIVSP